MAAAVVAGVPEVVLARALQRFVVVAVGLRTESAEFVVAAEQIVEAVVEAVET